MRGLLNPLIFLCIKPLSSSQYRLKLVYRFSKIDAITSAIADNAARQTELAGSVSDNVARIEQDLMAGLGQLERQTGQGETLNEIVAQAEELRRIWRG